MSATKAEGTLLASAARTATTVASPPNPDKWHRGVRLFLNFTVQAGAETITPQVEWVDPVSGNARAITAFAAVSATGTYVYELHPGSLETAATANHEVQGGSLPQSWQVRVTHSASGSHTYSLGYCLVP